MKRLPRSVLRKLAVAASGLPPSLAPFGGQELREAVAEARRRSGAVIFDHCNLWLAATTGATKPQALIPSDAFSLGAASAARAAKFHRKITLNARALLFRRLESKYGSCFDIIIPVSERDEELLRRGSPSGHFMTFPVPLPEEQRPVPGKRGFIQRRTIAVMGAFQVPEVAREAVVVLRAAGSRWQHISDLSAVDITGPMAKSRRLERDLDVDFAIRRHWISDYWAYLSSISIAIFPQASGSGVLTKAQQAMAAGCAVICTSSVAAGLGMVSSGAVTVADTADATCEAVIALLRDPLALLAMQRASATVARREWGPVATTARTLAIARQLQDNNA